MLLLLYRWSLPLGLLWVMGGHVAPHAPALYAAVDRLGYALVCGPALVGFFHNIDSTSFLLLMMGIHF